MFRILLCPSLGAHNYAVDYHIGRLVLGLLYVGGKVRLGWSSVWAAGLTAPNLQHTASQGMYSLRFTTLSNTNNTSNYQSTNETHYTQQNTTITTHKRSQLLILTETHYQLQPSDKELHTEHTQLRTIILH